MDTLMVATGPFNWTRSAAEENQENLAVCERSPWVGQFIEESARLWARQGL